MDENYFDEIEKILEENDWLEELLSAQGYCIVCGHDEPLDLEYHHVGGRLNSDVTVSLCRNCHGRISRGQRWWPKVWMNHNNPIDVCKAILFRGYSDLFRLVSDKYWERMF